MSHVSKKSVDQVHELIRLVRPEVVAVELCKERLGLLVDPEEELKGPKVWHSRKIRVEGLPAADTPEAAEWPSQEELLPLLLSRPGRPVTQQDIEADVVTLLSTGLFGSVRPGADNAGRYEAPEFVVKPPGVGEGSGREKPLALVPPLGCIRFRTTPRSLPAVTSMNARVDSSLKGVAVDEAAVEAICKQAVDDCKAGTSGLIALLRTKRRVQELLAGHQVTVSFKGVDSGRVEAIVKAVKPTDPPYMSGLEGTAVNGEGFGIEPFRPPKKVIQLSNKMYVPSEKVDELRAERLGAAAAVAAEAAAASGSTEAAAAGGVVTARVRAPLRPWTSQELTDARQDEPESKPLQDVLAGIMMSNYSRIQSKAGRTVGVERGEAWRAALEAATAVGSGAVLLADRPTLVTERRMADGLAADAGVRLLAALGVLVGSMTVAWGTSLLPDSADGGVLAAGLAAAAAVAAPVVGPFLEVSRFADMSAAEIEDAVAVKEPIDQGDLSKPLKLFGEDALLDWPGAFPALIPERDAFMAKALAAVATGKPGVAPAYVLDTVEGQAVWRFAAPEGAPLRSAPAGYGDGAIGAMSGVRAVVGVIGSAHVRGMVRGWREAVADPDVAALLTDGDSQAQAQG